MTAEQKPISPTIAGFPARGRYTRCGRAAAEQNYVCERAKRDAMVGDMLAVVKTYLHAMRSSFFIVDKEGASGELMADMWDDGWAGESSAMTKRRVRVNISSFHIRTKTLKTTEINSTNTYHLGTTIPTFPPPSFTHDNSPAAHVARTGQQLNIPDAYKDKRFSREMDPTTGNIVRATLVSPITDKHGVIGVVQLTNKLDGGVFDAEDQEIFDVFVKYCSLIVHFASMQQKMIFHNNLNKVYSSMLSLHLSPCKHDMAELMATGGVAEPPPDFHSFDFYISDATRADMPGLVAYMFLELFPPHLFDRPRMSEFVLTILQTYRPMPYHNSEHAFCFTHTMYLILRENSGYFDEVETIALLIGGLCHDLDHPGVNNNFLALTKHPLSQMYRTSTLEYHHYFMAKKIIDEKNILSRLPHEDRERVMEEIKSNILCTDLAVYFQMRAQLAPVVAEQAFDWGEQRHRRMLKGIIMTTCDLSGCCKPFQISKMIAEKVYEEFYRQGDMERARGYLPLSMMDRRRRGRQPPEQLQFLAVVLAPALLLLRSVLGGVEPLLENARKTQDGWREEIEIRGQKVWRQEDSIPRTRSTDISAST
ncbi:hypothetical protein JYU34_017306 [Plutella xylostella]|uniref:Phosphodiesterase n=1 Tax=Plutella xylostella TaxID=51655 RepID=A0ABQ7Q4N0_PLUXY|nr:hypothetical protein JYU34_017306 [Plutella xylostella]